MARSKSTVDEQTTPDMDLLTTAPDDWQFETVVEESPTGVILEVDDVFIGMYRGTEHIDMPEDPRQPGVDQSFDRFLFTGRDGQPYSINESYKLKEAFDAIPTGKWVRIKCTKEIPTKRGQNPMKDFQVDVRTN